MRLELGGRLRPSDKMTRFIETVFDEVQRDLGLEADQRLVRIELHRTLADEAEVREDAEDGGYCDITKVDPFLIRLALKRMSPTKIIATISHEMIHVRDLAAGDMKIVNDRDFYYRGEKINRRKQYLSHACDVDFVAMPYERVAYGLMYDVALRVLAKLPSDLLALVEAYDPEPWNWLLREKKRQQERTDWVLSLCEAERVNIRDAS